jgi:hypothetical protein
MIAADFWLLIRDWSSRITLAESYYRFANILFAVFTLIHLPEARDKWKLWTNLFEWIEIFLCFAFGQVGENN